MSDHTTVGGTEHTRERVEEWTDLELARYLAELVAYGEHAPNAKRVMAEAARRLDKTPPTR